MTLPAPVEPYVPAQAGPADHERKSEFYAAYWPRLLRYVTRRHGPRDAEEVTQETLVRAIATLDLERPSWETWAWLTLVARNLMIDIHRRRRQCDVATDESFVGAGEDLLASEDPEALAELHLDSDLVRRALEKVPHGQRRILWLYEVDRWTCPKIAEYLGHKENAVRQTLHKARRRLAMEFEAAGGRAGALLAPLAVLLRRRSLRKSRQATTAMAGGTGLLGACLSSVLGLSIYAAIPSSPDATAHIHISNAATARHTSALTAHVSRHTQTNRGGARVHRITRQPRRSPQQIAIVKAKLGRNPLRPGPVGGLDIVVNTPVGAVHVHQHVHRSKGKDIVCQLPGLNCQTPIG